MKAILKIISISTILCSCQIFEPKPQSEKFYCKIDGKAFRPDNGGDVYFTALLAEKSETNNLFYFVASGKDSRDLSISAKFKDLVDFKEKKYLVNEEFKATYSGNYIDKGNGVKIKERFETFSNSGFIEFNKIDTLTQTVSGKFEFNVKSIETGKTIAIKNGQFNDVFYY